MRKRWRAFAGLRRLTMSTKLKIAALVGVMLGIGALLLVKQQQIRRLEAENADLRTQLSQMASLQDRKSTRLNSSH